MKKVLLAEHDSFLIGVYANELRKNGFSVSVVRDERIIVSRTKILRPDVLVLGIHFTKLEKHEDLKDLKIILLSPFEHSSKDLIKEIKKLWNT
jgi:DNA-binding response OmpR family regulator